MRLFLAEGNVSVE